MMVLPSKEEMRMLEILSPWLILDGDTYVLDDGAPKEAEDMYEIFKQKYGIKV